MVTVKDDDFPERTGDYLVDTVELSLSQKEGGVRKITLGMKL